MIPLSSRKQALALWKQSRRSHLPLWTFCDTPKHGLHSQAGSSTHSNNSKQQPQQPQQQQRKYNSLNNGRTPYNICFLRHGQSTWNRDNRFIGWTDTPLTDDGVLEARVAGQMLHKSGMLFDEVHTSLLRRCIRTSNLVLMEMGQEYIPVHKNWRLNERNYGDLVGKHKKEIVKQHGVEQVKKWRRSYDEPPPPMQDSHDYHPANDPRYRLMLDKIPKSESLHCTMQRSSKYWDKVIAPQLHDGKTLLIVGHENNLRSLIMRLEGIPKEDIINLSLPRAVPLAYRLDENLKPLDRPDGQLDEATGFLRGEWLGGDEAVKEILDRDHKQVYDTSIEQNLEIEGESQDKWRTWMSVTVGDTPTVKTVKQETSHTAANENGPTINAMSNPGTTQKQHGPGAIQGCNFSNVTGCPDFIDPTKRKHNQTTAQVATHPQRAVNGSTSGKKLNGFSTTSSTRQQQKASAF
jgi:2,3-bisphosphoglycerate-dependent phosphoglycerate mutase